LRFHLGNAGSTIHALGSTLLRKSGNCSLLTPFAEKENAQAFAAEIQTYIDEIAEDESVGKDVLAFISEHPRPERTPESFASYEQYLDWIRYGRPRALQGENVKSFAELSIANFLWFNRVEYCSEQRYEFDVSAPTKKPYAPDFYLPKYGIYIEHFGVDRNNNPAPNIDKATYVAGTEWKRRVHKTHKTTLVETFSWMRSEGTLLSRLRELLRAKNVEFSERTVPDALNSVGGRDAASTLAKLITQVIPAFKESGRQIDDLESSFTNIDILVHEPVAVLGVEPGTNTPARRSSAARCLPFGLGGWWFACRRPARSPRPCPSALP
jgi:DNA helicase-4